MLAYVTSPFKKKKKKKTSTREGKKADVDADNLDALLEESSSDEDDENEENETNDDVDAHSPSAAVYLKRECIELKIKVNALEEQLLRDESGKGKERLSSAKLIMEKDAEISKLKEHNEEKEKLLIIS